MKNISIIVPHYNSPELLKILIKSVPIDDTLELIVVDDKSTLTKEMEEEIKLLIDERSGYFLKNTTDEKNAGVCRNIGLKQATGKWLLFADADDFFVEGAFDILKRHVDSDADIIYFPATSVYLGTDEIADRHISDSKLVFNYLKDKTKLNEMNLRYKIKGPVSKLVRKQMVDENDIWFDSVLTANDVMFSTKTGYCAKKITADKDVIYCITKSQGTLTTKKNEKLLEKRIDVFVRRYRYLEEHLDKKDFGLLNISGKSHLGKVIFDGYGIGTFWRTYRKFKKNHIKVFSMKEIMYDIRRFCYMLSVKKKDVQNHM